MSADHYSPAERELSATPEWERLLLDGARQVLHDFDASSVAVFLPDRDKLMLRAAVVVVTTGSIDAAECIPLGNPTFPTGKAFTSNQVATAHSSDVGWSHPEVTSVISAPSSVAAAPLAREGRRLGTLSVFWSSDENIAETMDLRGLASAAEGLAEELERLAPRGSPPPEPPPIPRVVSMRLPGREYRPNAPLNYHLARLDSLLASASSVQEAVDLTIARLVHGFTARAAVITLSDRERIKVASASGCAPDFLHELDDAPLGRSLPETDAMASLRPSLHPPEDPRTRGRCAPHEERCTWIVLPLAAGGRALGTCSVGYGPELDPARHRSALTSLAMLLGHTCGRLLVHDIQTALAESLQRTLLPPLLAQPAGVVSTSRYRPAVTGIDLGGDWYDLISQPAGPVTLVIGDVQGHTTEAAALMGQLRSATRAYAYEGHGPEAVLGRTNALLNTLGTDLFATCCCMCVDPQSGLAHIATAGHPPPLIRTADGCYPSAVQEMGVPLGIEENPGYLVQELPLEPGTIVALYTDGMAGPDGELTSGDLEAALIATDNELELLADKLFATGHNRPSRPDDAALLLVRYEGPQIQPGIDIKSMDIQRQDLLGAGRARHLIRSWLQDWSLSPVADDAQTLVSEVVTNALVHADSDVSLHVRRYPNRIRVEVRDSDPHPAHAITKARQEDKEEDGRGLLIVSAIASAWGNSPSGRGKTVWFELPTTTGSAATGVTSPGAS